MNNEELERKMAFIVNQQAQFAVGMDLFREETERKLSRLEDVVAEMGNVVTRLAHVTNEGFKQFAAKIDALIDAHIRHEQAFAAQQKRTDERFEAVATRFDAMTDRFDAMTDRFEGLTERFEGLTGKLEGLTASQNRTEELLQKFLRGLTNRRNGK